MAVAGHRDLGILDVLRARGDEHRVRERDPVVGRAHEVDVRVARGEPRPGEVDVSVAHRAGAVDLDRCLVVELPFERRRRALVDRGRALILEAVVRRRRRVGAVRVCVARDPDVAEALRGSRRVAGRLGAEERAAVAVPRDHRVSGARGADLGEPRVRRGVAGIARDERADPARAGVLRTVVAEPDRAGGDGMAVRVRRVVDTAVVVRAAEQHARVPRVDGDGGLVLPAVRDGALVERGIRIGITGGERVGRDVAGAARAGVAVVRQAGVAAGRGDARDEHEAECGHESREQEPSVRLPRSLHACASSSTEGVVLAGLLPIPRRRRRATWR